MQASLFDVGAPTFDPRFPGLRQIELAHGGWIHHVPRLVRGHAALFRQLRDGQDWQARQRPMYERVVAVPRMLATIEDDGCTPRILFQLSHVLSRRYGRDLSRIHGALYRDGQDSVAPHQDRVRNRSDTVIAIVSLGQPRRFLLRPLKVGDGPGHDFALGWGDLLVMGGTCQQFWRHAIPKCALAGPRISVQYREASTADPEPDAPDRPAPAGPTG